MENDTKEIILEIADYFLYDYKKSEIHNDISLQGGDSGALLFQSLFFKVSEDIRYLEAAQHNLKYIVALIADFENDI